MRLVLIVAAISLTGQDPSDRTTGANRTPGGLDIPLEEGLRLSPEGSAMPCLDSAHTTASVK